jgi:predicted nuclease of restriction endonuclease-like (RecB) superfamily
MTKKILVPSDYTQAFDEIKRRVRAAQYEALKAVNLELITLYWDIGGIIVTRQQSAAWGRSVVKRLAEDLQQEFPGVSGFSASNLWRMRNFYKTYAADQKLAPLVREIGWSHNVIIMERCRKPQQQQFYIRMTAKFGWTKNVLALRIEDQTYEKTLLGQNNFEETLPEPISPQAKLAVRDEYKLPDPEQIERLLEAVELPKGKEDAVSGEGG